MGVNLSNINGETLVKSRRQTKKKLNVECSVVVMNRNEYE